MPKRTFRWAKERLRFSNQTRGQAAESPNINIGDITQEAVKAYWKARKQESQGDEDPDILKETALLNRQLARRMDRSVRRGFVSDAFAVAVPLALMLVTLYLFLKANRVPPNWVPITAIGITVVLSSFIVITYRFPDILKRLFSQYKQLRFVRDSSGALFGSLIMTALIGVIIVNQIQTSANLEETNTFLRENYDDLTQDNVDLAFDYAHTKMQHVAVLSMKHRYRNGVFAKDIPETRHISLKTEGDFTEQAVYKANVTGIAGTFVGTMRAEIDPQEGRLYRILQGTSELKNRFLVGTASEVATDSFILKTWDGATKKIGFNPENIYTKLIVGTRVVVALDPTDSAVLIEEIE